MSTTPATSADPAFFTLLQTEEDRTLARTYMERWFFGEKGLAEVKTYFELVRKHRGPDFPTNDALRALDHGIFSALSHSVMPPERRGDVEASGDEGVENRSAFYMACRESRFAEVPERYRD